MEYKQIEAFLSIARLRNITKAADALFVSQSALSHRLKMLEEEVGLTLVSRNKGIASIRLTPKGEEFLSIAQEWEQVYRKALAFSQLTEKSTIRIAAPASIHDRYSEIYSRITSDSKKARLAVSTHNSNKIPEIIENKEADIGFGFIYESNPRLLVKAIHTDPMVLAERSGKRREDEEIDPSSMDPKKALLIHGISLDNPDCARYYNAWFGRNMPYLMQIDSPALLLKNMQEGCWCIIPGPYIGLLGEAPDIHIYSLEKTGFTLPLYLFLHKDAEETIRTFTKKYFEEN